MKKVQRKYFQSFHSLTLVYFTSISIFMAATHYK